MNLVLTGLRGTGKSNIGRRLARLLGWTFCDTDLLIEQQVGEPITQFVDRLGWEAFRDREHGVVAELASRQETVISTGGGALTYARNVAALKPNSLIILLAADPLTLAKRLGRSYARPPLTDQPSLAAEMVALWQEREPLYRQVCDVVFDVEAETADADADIQRKASALLAIVRPFFVKM